MKSLRSAIAQIGLGFPFGLHEVSIKPTSIKQLIRACTPPRMTEWGNPERSRVENAPWTEELNGLVTDGSAWYASCNANDDREGVYKLTMGFDIVKKRAHPFDVEAVHMGALSVRGGELFIPLQGTLGVWVVDAALVETEMLYAPHTGEDVFAWCDVNPHNGMIYTCRFENPEWLYAFRRETGQLVRDVKHDIPIACPDNQPPTTRVQGGCFTPNYRWLAVCDVDAAERIHIHSTLNGMLLDSRELLADTDESPWADFTRNELEGIWCAFIRTGAGNDVQVHVLELNNEIASTDDIYLWHFSVPDPTLL